MYKQDISLNNLQGFIYRKTQPTNLQKKNKYKQSMDFKSTFCIGSKKY